MLMTNSTARIKVSCIFYKNKFLLFSHPVCSLRPPHMKILIAFPKSSKLSASSAGPPRGLPGRTIVDQNELSEGPRDPKPGL